MTSIAGPAGRALLLGLTQGVAEVLPVSSSAHLTLVPWLLGWPDQRDRTTLAAGLHAGSALGIAWALRQDLASLGPREALQLAATTVPAAVTGLLAADLVEARLGRPRQVAALMAAAGLALAAADRRPTGSPAARASAPHHATSAASNVGDLRAETPAKITNARTLLRAGPRRWRSTGRNAGQDHQRSGQDGRPPGGGQGASQGGVTGRAAAAAAFAQVAALAPGVSRNGATLTALRTTGVGRAEAQRFSLLMSLPITVGAAGLTLTRADRESLRRLLPFVALGGSTAALAAGLTVTRVPAGPWWPVALYRLGLAATVVVRARGRRR